MKTDLSHDAYHTTWAWQEVGTSTNSCPRSRFKHAACLSGGFLYLFGGKDGRTPLKDFWRCHLGSLIWERVSCRGEALPHLEGHTLVACQRLILIFGGQLSDGLHGPPLWILNTDLLHLRKISCDNEVAGGPTGRRDHTAVLYNNVMFVYGGFVDLRGSSAEFWMYSINEEQWSQVTTRSRETPGGRHGHSAVVVRNSMWLFGGMNGLTVKSDVWRFSFTLRTWQRLKCLGSPPPVTGHSAHVVDGVMYIIGGEIQGELKNDVWCLPLDSLTWRKISPVPSLAAMPPSTQHASVWIDTQVMNQDSDTSRCLSEPYLQAAARRNSLEMRPVSSPPAANMTNSRSAQFNQISPVDFKPRGTPNKHISMTKTDDYRDRSNQTFFRQREDQQALMRPVSLESDQGLDNIVVSLQDEDQLDDKDREAIMYMNEHTKFEIPKKNRSFPVNSIPNLKNAPSQFSFNKDQTKANKIHAHIKDQNSYDRRKYVNNSVVRKTRRSGKSCPRESCENCPNPSKAIRSYLCNDLYVEDLEVVSDGVADFVGCVMFTEEFNKTGSHRSESIELCEIPNRIVCTASVADNCDTDMGLQNGDVCDSSPCSGHFQNLPCEMGCIVTSDNNCPPIRCDTHSLQHTDDLPVKNKTECRLPNQSDSDFLTRHSDSHKPQNCRLAQSNSHHQPIETDTDCLTLHSDSHKPQNCLLTRSNAHHQPIETDTDCLTLHSDIHIPQNTNCLPVHNKTDDGSTEIASDILTLHHDTHRTQDMGILLVEYHPDILHTHTDTDCLTLLRNPYTPQNGLPSLPVRSTTDCEPTEMDTNCLTIQSDTHSQPKQSEFSQPQHTGKLVSTGTQTDITVHSFRNDCRSNIVQQVDVKTNCLQQMSSTFTDTQVSCGRVLVIGGKVSQGHFLSKPISMWAGEIF